MPDVDVMSLSPDQKHRMQLNKLKAQVRQQSRQTPALHHNIGLSWFKVLSCQFSKPYFTKLSQFVESERGTGTLSQFVESERGKATVYPSPDQVYSWTHHCSLEEVKVVVLGQDPYHGPNQAHGLCFSVTPGVRSPPSLVNMYKELSTDIPGFVTPSHGYLLGWAKQGVLLLNACLTVRAHTPNSHKDQGWEHFTDEVIKAVSHNNRGVVFLLWGSYAQKKAAHVDKNKHHLLRAPHPSPLSAHRGFFGCKHFSKCNELLQKEGKRPINWSHLDENV
ncbi:hypothetical protein Pcinc_014275 [Petrolisthes cinctipes]|uniref:Uracil-DNA glycosylase n=1 Tax=Petrolisthes cinctipes TaxID=88211 RepID=A0AAE1KTF2_PETCI|nr:hypothetical protein Pcinc_014275 [Petrolisthes cinctipes]